MLSRIMEAEHAQITAEYKQKIANLEIQVSVLLFKMEGLMTQECFQNLQI